MEAVFVHEKPPNWLLAQIESHILHLELWIKMYGSDILSSHQRERMDKVSCSANLGATKHTTSALWVQAGPMEEEPDEDTPGCKT
jgi:hypothetical protein